jgi:hypothetical protein
MLSAGEFAIDRGTVRTPKQFLRSGVRQLRAPSPARLQGNAIPVHALFFSFYGWGEFTTIGVWRLAMKVAIGQHSAASDPI